MIAPILKQVLFSFVYFVGERVREPLRERHVGKQPSNINVNYNIPTNCNISLSGPFFKERKTRLIIIQLHIAIEEFWGFFIGLLYSLIYESRCLELEWPFLTFRMPWCEGCCSVLDRSIVRRLLLGHIFCIAVSLYLDSKSLASLLYWHESIQTQIIFIQNWKTGVQYSFLHKCHHHRSDELDAS